LPRVSFSADIVDDHAPIVMTTRRLRRGRHGKARASTLRRHAPTLAVKPTGNHKNHSRTCSRNFRSWRNPHRHRANSHPMLLPKQGSWRPPQLW